jgi:hypothetical protein
MEWLIIQFHRQGDEDAAAGKTCLFFKPQSRKPARASPCTGAPIAWLALYAPKEFSGSFMSYDDPLISRPWRLVCRERIAIPVDFS